MLRRLLADLPRPFRTLVVMVPVLLLFLLVLSPPSSQALPEADPAAVQAMLSRSTMALVPFAPVTGPATGGPVLTPRQHDDLTARVEEIIADGGGRVGIALQDLRTGATFSHGSREPFATASVVKLTILTMLVLRAREEGRELTETERAEASVMIRYSDNDVTNGLYERIGYNPGFVEGAETLGFTDTEPHPHGVWGGTLTTPADQMRLLRALYTDEGPLTADERAYVRDLMESVAPEQAWGVSAAAREGDVVGLKNGWTPRESDSGRWMIHSVGYVAGPERVYLIAVMSDGHPDHGSGIAVVESVVAEVTSTLGHPPVDPPAGAPPSR
ncbi:serine hydrolase [Nocardiopsis sp. N85]|uniref:serine hydrolase n=1 Tax=Nocardiopsis sp. N85 TaxID=3029400 RepID=UPI00237F44CA|nr:serine hydrolase [Nocardiopsis sp. N85]MDE3719867.1 serine hydrolase [Nocardiopsis sp. N85]